jgi:hypothetical protein
MIVRAGALASLLALQLITQALAAQDNERPVAYPKPHLETPREVEIHQWYGLPLAAVGAASVIVTVIGRAAQSDRAVIFGVSSGMVSGLVFHVMITPVDQLGWGLGKGLLSVLIRAGLGGGACALGPGCNELTTRALVRTSLGMLMGIAIDAALLARRTLTVPREDVSFRLVPLASRESVGLQLSARW